MPGNKSFLRIVVLLTILLTHCHQKKSSEDRLKGAWEAKWLMDPGTGEQLQTMNGKFEFYPDGTVHIEAYGYQGCMFACDTLSNNLHWKMEDDILRITDKGENSGLPYKIQYFSDDSLHLTLLDEIHVILLKM